MGRGGGRERAEDAEASQGRGRTLHELAAGVRRLVRILLVDGLGDKVQSIRRDCTILR